MCYEGKLKINEKNVHACTYMFTIRVRYTRVYVQYVYYVGEWRQNNHSITDQARCAAEFQ